MSTIRTRIARLTAASALVLAMGAGAAGPALATGTWAGSVPNSATVAVDDGASPETIGRGGGIRSVEDGAGTDALILAGDFAPAAWASPAGQIISI